METVPQLTVHELQRWRNEHVEHLIVDIREIHEVAVSGLGGKHIPMAFCLARQNEIPRNIPVVIHCRSGARSMATVSALMSKCGFSNLHNLQGGIKAWAKDIHPGLEVA